MTRIQLITLINAPITDVFNAARNIDVHMASATKTKEKAIAGTTKGLIGLHETVTWRGKHFGLYVHHKSKITEMKYPTYFVDEMVEGHFKSFKHQHIFKETDSGTEMIDILDYQTPYGIFGKLFDSIILKKYLTQFLKNRNNHIATVCIYYSKSTKRKG